MNLKKTLGVIGAVATCPGHLPIWVAVLGGTAAGAWLSENLLLAGAAAGLLFLVSLRIAFGKGWRPGNAGSSGSPPPRAPAQEGSKGTHTVRDPAGASDRGMDPSGMSSAQ